MLSKSYRNIQTLTNKVWNKCVLIRHSYGILNCKGDHTSSIYSLLPQLQVWIGNDNAEKCQSRAIWTRNVPKLKTYGVYYLYYFHQYKCLNGQYQRPVGLAEWSERTPCSRKIAGSIPGRVIPFKSILVLSDCLLARRSTLRGWDQDWLARCQDNVTGWCTCVCTEHLVAKVAMWLKYC